MSRLSVQSWLMELAYVVAMRGTCARRQVGCVLADVKGRILATGYNGVARGVRHCIDAPCLGATMPSGQGLDLCQAIHAEQNALLQCRNVDEVFFCVTTTEPCAHCAKLLLNTGCTVVLYAEPYPQGGGLAQWYADQGRKGAEWYRWSPTVR